MYGTPTFSCYVVDDLYNGVPSSVITILNQDPTRPYRSYHVFTQATSDKIQLLDNSIYTNLVIWSSGQPPMVMVEHEYNSNPFSSIYTYNINEFYYNVQLTFTGRVNELYQGALTINFL